MRTLVGVVLDRSGSMSSVLQDTIGGFNSFVEKQRQEGHDQVYVVTQFDNEYDVIQDGVELDDVIVLDKSNYVPRGSTALLDAIGRTISSMDALLDQDRSLEQAILVVVTDGEENASQEFTKEQVLQLIEDREGKSGTRWEFIFLGAGRDAIKQARSFGIRNSAQYTGSSSGMMRAFNAMTQSVTNYSTGASSDLSSQDLTDETNSPNV